jgi:MFS transporter, FSR family, fosmidomycin resistance protein
MNKQAIAAFAPGHFLIDFCQGVVPALVSFLVIFGVTLGLAVSVGGMCAPLLGRLATARGLGFVLGLLLVMLLVATVQAFALPPVRSGERAETGVAKGPVTADLSG